MTPLQTLTVPPLAPRHTHTVIFLHGRGDNIANFSDSLQYTRDSRDRTLAETFPTFRWVFPQAPRRRREKSSPDEPDGIFDNINQWFDIWSLTDADAPENERFQIEGLRDVVPQLRDLVASEAAHLRGRWDRVILMGISMGSATATHLLLNLDVPAPERRLGALVGFSGRCPLAGKSLGEMRRLLGLEAVPADDEVVRNTPVMLQHCVNDPLVPVAWGRTQRDVLRGFGADVTWCEYPNGGHWMNSPRGTDDVVDFLIKALGWPMLADDPPKSSHAAV
ncbi:hypothetical protein E4U21_005869 [Claviceps maximensis]|nr:hypothetical protein E4U21_005869 [Claviceps maximensis]